MMRGVLLSLLLLVAARAAAQARWIRLDSVVAAGTYEIGVWQKLPAGAFFTVSPVPGNKDEFCLEMLYSDDLTIAPGTYFGTMRRTAKPGVYDATLLLNPRDNGKSWRKQRKRTFAINLSPEGTMNFVQYTKGLRMNFARLLPYLFRFSVSSTDTRPEGLDGARRVAPEPSGDIIVL